MAVDLKKPASIFRSISAFAALLAAVAGPALPGVPAKADTVAADGAVGANIAWENGTAPYWYSEIQRQGLFSIVGGMASEHDSEIRKGLLELDWGMDHQAADGSFPESAGAGIGEQFHCNSWFVEAAAHAALLLKSYAPTTYTPDAAYYNSQIARLTASAHSGCEWLMSPKIQPEGWVFDSDCAHRRYLLASALAETAALTGDAALKADSLTYVKNGLSRQLGAGWRAAIIENSDGTYPAATLLAPGASAPANTVKIISAVGVNPEKSGYDTEYQCTGMYLANVYYDYCTDSTIKQELIAMTRAGLAWESGEVESDGTVSTIGDSRIGIETNRTGNIKEPTKGVTRGAFNQGYVHTGDEIDNTYATRIYDQGMPIDSNAISPYGAVDGNEAWEHNKTLPWSIGGQQIAADYVEEGIAQENDSLIQQGLLIFHWGFVHQKSDGSFGTTEAPCAGAGAFIEAAARAASELKAYAPKTYTPATNYVAWAEATLPKCAQCLNWLTTRGSGIAAQSGIADSPSGLWTVAAALAETGRSALVPALQAESRQFAARAMAFQMPSGEEPENGALNVTDQGVGMNFAQHYLAACTDPASVGEATAAVNSGLEFEGQYISAAGNIEQGAEPSLLELQRTFGMAENLPDGEYFTIVRARLGGLPTE